MILRPTDAPHPRPARTPPLLRCRHPSRQDGCLRIQGVHLRRPVLEALLRRVRCPLRGDRREGEGQGALGGRGDQAGQPPGLLCRYLLRSPRRALGSAARRGAQERGRRAEQGARGPGAREHQPRWGARAYQLYQDNKADFGDGTLTVVQDINDTIEEHFHEDDIVKQDESALKQAPKLLKFIQQQGYFN